MKRLKASAALVCTLLMGWSQIIQPYSAYALSVQAAAASQSVSQTSNEYESQGASSQGAQDDASGSQGVTEWYGDDANAARPDGGVDSDSGEQPGIGIEESRVDESNGEAPTDDSTEMNSCEADSLEPNSWRFENGVLIDSDNGDIDAQSLTDDPLPNGAVARGIDVSNHQGTVDWNKVKAAGIDFAILKVGPVYGKPDDSFERNAAECERLGIPYGVYYYSYARSVEDANKGPTGHLLGSAAIIRRFPFIMILRIAISCKIRISARISLPRLRRLFATVWRPLALSRVSMRTLTGLTTT